MTRKDALEILGLEADASLDEAKRAYRELSRRYHPDRNPAPNATAMFRYIHDAWEYIQNDAKTRQQAEGTQKQAEAKRRAEAENAQQQTEAKNSNPDEHHVDETETTVDDWVSGCGCAVMLITIVFAGIVGVIDSCGTADKPVENSKTYIDRGKAKVDKGEYFEAISDYDMAIQLEPANAKSYDYRGEAKEELGQYAAAIVDYDTAISLNPFAIYAYNSRGWAKYRLGQHAAVTDYDTAIRLDQDNARAYYYRGLAKEKVEGSKGRKDFGKALELAAKVKDWDLHSVIKRNMY